MAEAGDDHIVIEEVITIDGSETKNERAEFATVVFHNIAETYPEDAHIECNYTVTSDLVPTTRDWVALYKVGWMNPRDYIYYEWAPLPKNYQVGVDADASVLFPAHKLPNDDGEFYQFCYVSSSKQIRGASTPFQFRKPGADDFVEIEDEETNMLVIRSKTIYLEENLQKAESQRQRLVETQEALQKERDSIITKYQEAKNKLVAMETENRSLKGQVSTGEGQIEQLKVEARDMLTLREELELKIKKLSEERNTLEAKCTEIAADKENLQTKIKQLMNEKDELAGKNANLAEQSEMYKKHYTSTETAMEQYTKHSEDLQIKVAQQESLIDHLKLTVDKLTTELEDNRQNLDKQTAINIHDKEKNEDLEERLKNAEDKLCAAEESKHILQKEIVNFEEVKQQLSSQLEKSKTDCDSVKQKLCRLEEDFTQKTLIQKQEMEYITDDLKGVIQEKEKLQLENSTLQQRLSSTQEVSDTNHGSMSIMKQSLTQIKERLEKKEKQHRGLEKALRSRELEFLEREREMRREIEDLKEKIYMCSEEYKTLYIEKSKLQRKLSKATGKRKSRSKTTADPMVESATLQKSEAGSEIGEVDTRALEQQVEELAEELEQKLTSKYKYKDMYNGEKETREGLEKLVVGKDAEIDRLKKRIMEMPNELDLKLRTLEKCVTEKEMIIEELNNKLRQANQGRNDETGASMSPRSAMPYGPSCGHEAAPNANMPYLPYMVYPPQQVQYPYPTQMPMAGPPHMVYPTGAVKYPAHNAPRQQVPPIPPRKTPARPIPGEVYDLPKELEKRDSSEDLKLLEETSRDEADQLGEVLKPLPPPLQPVKLPSAKVAAVKSATRSDEEKLYGGEFAPELTVKLPSAPAEADNREQDRFYDAEGAAMKLCPVCTKSFPADVDERAFLEHQVEHMELTLCPFCKMSKPDNMSDDDFTRHVNQHCDNDENEIM